MQMLTVRLASGKVLATVPTKELTTVRALKQRLRGLCDATRFRQRLLHDGALLEDDDKLDGPLELQLVLMNFINPSHPQLKEILSASASGAVSELEAILCRPQDPNRITSGAFREAAPTAPGNAWPPYSPLQTAARCGKLEALRLLLEARADVGPNGCNIADRSLLGRPPWSSSALQLLLAAKANTEKKDAYSGQTALSLAVMLGNEAAVQVLLEAGARRDSQDHDGLTPLHQACRQGHLSMVRLLLAAGISNLQAAAGPRRWQIQRLLSAYKWSLARPALAEHHLPQHGHHP